ncbi:Probable RNA methyltransferase bin3 [Eumeta japonica]|uniref:RNA methyltransferase n=1 Tax=Eumeta variegata TaxID=151549 RepID=A0A4C1VEL5_EUMVA|nr:Probable RNA methyltransferase bin3 [Eumeta japonica]
MDSFDNTVLPMEEKKEADVVFNKDVDNQSERNVCAETTALVVDEQSVSESTILKDPDATIAGSAKKSKKKFRHSKKGHVPAKDNTDRNIVRRIHHSGTKFKQCRKRAQSFPSLSKFFLPHKRPRKESSPLPTPPRHKAKIDVIIPPNIRDPLNLLEPLDNDEYEKRLEMQQRKPRKRTKIRRRTTEAIMGPPEDKCNVKDEGAEESVTADIASHVRKRSGSESDNAGQKCKDVKKLRRLDSLDKIVSPVVPQPGAWMRARAPSRSVPSERPVSPHRVKQKVDKGAEIKLPKFDPKNSRYEFGNYDRYYGYRNLNSMMDVRLQVFEMHRHLFQNKDVLDIGCNVGHITIAVAKTLGARSAHGIDIDPMLIARARKNLRSFIPVPSEPLKIEDDKKLQDGDKSTDDQPVVGTSQEQKLDKSEDEKKSQHGKKIRRPRKNRKAGKQEQQYYFPMSMSFMYGSLGMSIAEEPVPTFPHNVTFKCGNYVPREEMPVGVGIESAQYDLILCLSTTKWMHLNWGDAGLKRAFRRMFADLRPGGKLVLEAQNWASYKLKKRLTPTIYENFNSIELLPNKFRDYLLSPEVGFSKCCILGVPQHASKGFRRPIQLYIKGDFTPSKACWSDAYAPSSHHRSETEPPRRTVYAPVEPAYRPSDDAPSCGAATPFSPNLDCCADDSPFYNPRSDSYAPSYEPPRPTVYATLPSPLAASAGAGASPVASPAASPAPPAASPAPAPASPAHDPLGARVYPAYSPCAYDD